MPRKIKDTESRKIMANILRCCTVQLDIIKVLLPIDAQKKCFKRRIKIYIKNVPTYFGVITIIRERNI